MNYLEFTERMLLYAVVGTGTFRLDIQLRDISSTVTFDKINAKPFILDVPFDIATSDLDMQALTAKIMQVDMNMNADASLSSIETCPVAVININDVTTDFKILYNIIGCNARLMQLTTVLNRLDAIVQAAAINVINSAVDIATQDAACELLVGAQNANSFSISAETQDAVLDMLFSMGTITVKDFNLDIAEQLEVLTGINKFAAAMAMLVVADVIGVDVSAVSARVNEFSYTISDEAIVSIIGTVMKYMTIGDYEDTTIGDMGVKTLSELSIRIR